MVSRFLKTRHSPGGHETSVFSQTFVNQQRDPHRPWAMAASLLGQCLAVGGMVLAPLVFTYELPLGRLVSQMWITAPPPPAAPAPLNAAKPVAKPPERFQTQMRVPSVIPDAVALIDDRTSAELAGNGAPSLGGVVGGIAGFGSNLAGIRQPWNLAPPLVREPLRVGGSVQAARLVHQVMPVFPLEASQERVEGVVKLEAIITTAGLIRSLKVLEGHELLRASAVEAVRQWRYRPTRLNGKEVEVRTRIDVVFQLAELEIEEEKKHKKRRRKNK